MRFLCLCKSVLSFCEFNFGEDFVHQVIGITSRCQACSKVFNVLLKQYFRRVCPQEPKSFSFNEAFFNACWVATVVVCVLKCFSRFVMCPFGKAGFPSDFVKVFSAKQGLIHDNTKVSSFVLTEVSARVIASVIKYWKLFKLRHNMYSFTTFMVAAKYIVTFHAKVSTMQAGRTSTESTVRLGSVA